MPEARDVEHILEKIGDLPALPSVVAEVLRVTEDPNSNTTDVSECIQTDPALTAKVLRISNSPYYGMRQYVGTLKLALVILGVHEVRNIVLGVSVFETLTEKQLDLLVAKEVWNNSLRTAGLARMLTKHIGLGLQGEDFIAGLLSDIGKMGLLRQYSEDYSDLYLDHRDNPQALRQAEIREFGYDHTDVALALAMRWHLPQTLADALWYQYPTEGRELRNAKDPSLAAIIRVSRLAWLDDLTDEESGQSVRDPEAWAILDRTKRAIPPEDRRGLLQSLRDEVDKMALVSL